MAKRKSDYDCEAWLQTQMADREEIRVDQLYPRTPGKRQRRTSDVIDSMGESPLFSPASTSTSYFSRDPSTPSSSIGVVTPQRPTSNYWQPSVSPDIGYSSPMMDKSSECTPDWVYSQPVSSQESSQPRSQRDTSVACMPSTLSFTLSEKLLVPDDTDSLPVSASGRMTVHKDSVEYNMTHPNRGKCVVFNHENFDTGFAPRHGTIYDAEQIQQTFQRLGFHVEICNDFDHSAITEKIRKLSEEDHSDNDCLCIFVLTHGMSNDFICAKDAAYKTENLWKPFTAERCQTLAGKPKLFFFQACRGDNLDPGLTLVKANNLRTETDSFSDTAYKIPTHADFLFSYSTPQGFYSWRDSRIGTWYVQSICEVLNKEATTTDLLKMLTMAARKVATDYTSYHDLDEALNAQKQIPSMTSMLIRDVYFRPKSQ